MPVTETFSAGRFAELARAEIDEALAAGRRPIVVGGTGLYLQAALTDLELRPPPAPELRQRLAAELDARGPAAMHAELAERAPAAAAAIDAGDRSRIIRALELLEMGESAAPAGAGSRLWTAELRHPTLLCGLVMERAELYRRIDARVDAMVAAGAVEEVRRADAAGASATARKALGFEELLRGDVEAMKRRTRNYARRQLTWMRRLERVQILDASAAAPAELAGQLVFPRPLRGGGALEACRGAVPVGIRDDGSGCECGPARLRQADLERAAVRAVRCSAARRAQRRPAQDLRRAHAARRQHHAEHDPALLQVGALLHAQGRRGHAAEARRDDPP